MLVQTYLTIHQVFKTYSLLYSVAIAEFLAYSMLVQTYLTIHQVFKTYSLLFSVYYRDVSHFCFLIQPIYFRVAVAFSPLACYNIGIVLFAFCVAASLKLVLVRWRVACDVWWLVRLLCHCESITRLYATASSLRCTMVCLHIYCFHWRVKLWVFSNKLLFIEYFL